MNLEKLVLEYKTTGNEDCFNKIYELTLPIVKAAIINYIADRETVLDLIQDTYMLFISNKEAYKAKSFNNWIYTVAKNKTLDYLKKKKETKLEEYDNIKSNDISPNLKFLINKLDENLREVFILKVLVGYSTKKISESLNLTIGQVNKMYYDAKEILKKELSDINEIQ